MQNASEDDDEEARPTDPLSKRDAATAVKDDEDIKLNGAVLSKVSSRPSGVMNRDPTTTMSSIAHTPPAKKKALTDVLEDPAADWAEVRAAIRTHAGRGVATNAGVLAASFTRGGGGGDGSSRRGKGEDFARYFEECLDIAEGGGGDGDPPQRPADCGGGVKLADDRKVAAVRRDDDKSDSVRASGRGERVGQLPPRNLPARQLPRKGSVKGGSSFRFRGSLENVLEDQESGGEANDSDSSDDDDDPFERNVAKLRIVPARYLPRKTSKKGGSFRNILGDVAEEADADGSSAAIGADEAAGGVSPHAPPPPRQLPRKNSGIAGFRRASLESMHEYYSNSSLSTACSDRRKFLSRDDSVNVMDFGVSQRRFTDSALSLGNSSGDSTRSFNSSAIDSDGFLPWADNDSSSENASYYRPLSKSRGQELSDSQSSSLSNLVDSVGFMDWQGIERSSTPVKERAAAVDDSGAKGIKECNNEREPDAQDVGIDESRQLHESWRIEDYEKCTDDIMRSGSGTMRSGSGTILSGPVKRLTDALKRNSWDVSTNEDQKAPPVNTGEIKRVLLRGRSSEETLPTANNRRRISGERRLRNSTFGTLFSGLRNSGTSKSTEPPPGEDEQHCRAIRISREDDVDVYQLRRELCAAGAGSDDDDKNARGRMKFGLFSRVDSVRLDESRSRTEGFLENTFR